MAFVHFRLIDRKEDPKSFFLEPNGTEDHSRKLNFNNTYGILNPYFIEVNGVRIYKRYIVGCPIYDPAEQDKQKIIANRQTTLVEFKRGADIDLHDTRGKVLIDWLRAHPLNKSSENHNAEIHDAIFFEYDPKEETKKEIEVVDQQDKAMDILRLLKKTPERMRSVALVFEDTKGLSDDDEIYIGLRKVAQERPTTFIDSIANKENEVLSDILKGFKYQIIGKDAKAFFYEADKAIIFSTTTKSQKEAQAELVTYLMDREGDIHYRQLLIKIQQKEIELNAPVGITPPPKEEE